MDPLIHSVSLTPPLTNIDCLPPELLASIFEASADGANPHSPDGFFDAQMIIAWSQVCQLWRNVALSMRHLWTAIDVRHGSAEELYSRSSPLPIHITLVGPLAGWELSNKGKRALNRLQRYADRVQELRVSADAEVIDVISSNLHSTAFPMLTSLHLTSTWDAFIVQFEPVALAPNLRQLYLDSVAVDFHIIANLTHVYIDNNRGNFTGEELLLLLEKSPYLQTLSLLYADLDDEDLSDTDIHVELAHIERLHLEALDQSFVEYIFAHIFIPSTAPLLGRYSSRNQVATSHDILYLDSLQSEHECTLDLDYRQGTMTIYHGGQPPVLKVSVDAVASLIAFISAFIDVPPIRALALKKFGGQGPTSVDFWASFFSHFAFLTRMHIESSWGFTRNVLLALWPDSDSPSSTRNICPHLKHLHLDFNESEIDSELLGRFVLKRLEAGARIGQAPLKTLTIRVANSSGLSMADELSNLVDVFTLKPRSSVCCAICCSLVALLTFPVADDLVTIKFGLSEQCARMCAYILGLLLLY
jgi:hypothetical protein